MNPPLIAATAGGPLGGLLLLALVVTIGYVMACAVWPFASCRRCGGVGRFRSPSGRAWRKCPRCRGSGTRIRQGRRLWTSLHRTHERGTRDT